MRWTIRLGVVLLLSLVLLLSVITGSKSVFSWLQTLSTESLEEPLTEERFLKEEMPKGDGPVELARNDKELDFREQLSKTEFQKRRSGSDSGNSLKGNLGVILIILFFSAILFYKFKQNRKSRLSYIEESLPTHLPPDDQPITFSSYNPSFSQLTNVSVRDSLITFNDTLPSSLRIRWNETFEEWSSRIELFETDSSLYHAVRYGALEEENVPLEELERFRDSLQQYLSHRNDSL